MLSAIQGSTLINLFQSKGEFMFQFFMFCSETGYWPVPVYLELAPVALTNDHD